MVAIFAFALVSLLICLVLRQSHPAYALPVAAVAGVILLVRLLTMLYSPLQELLNFLQGYGLKSELVTYLLKSLGICYLTKFAGDLCADFGQTSLAGKVELTGRVMLFILSVPLIRQMLEWGLALL